jgi:hypothetical protein
MAKLKNNQSDSVDVENAFFQKQFEQTMKVQGKRKICVNDTY